jgi:hypothetical protein
MDTEKKYELIELDAKHVQAGKQEANAAMIAAIGRIAKEHPTEEVEQFNQDVAAYFLGFLASVIAGIHVGSKIPEVSQAIIEEANIYSDELRMQHAKKLREKSDGK